MNSGKTKTFGWLARSHGLVVKADGSCSRGCGFEPPHRILDGCKQCLLLHQRKIENKNNIKKKKKLDGLTSTSEDCLEGNGGYILLFIPKHVKNYLLTKTSTVEHIDS